MKTVIFIHGNASSSRVFEPIIQTWQLPIQLKAIDLPGHGNSPRKEEYSWNSNKNFLLEKINHIEGDVILMGNSLGGLYAVELAPMIRSLKGIVLIGSSPLKKPVNFKEAFLPNPHTEAFLKVRPTEKEIDDATSEAVQNKAVIPLLKEDFYSTDTKARTKLLDWLSAPNVFQDQVEIFSKLQCSKYIIVGKEDTIVNPDYLKKLVKEALNPIEFIEMENCGHVPTIEKPVEFTKLLVKICDEAF